MTLSFTPIVLAENRISLRVSTEVTEVDPENQIRIGNIAVPGMKVRKSETTVELPSGAVMMTAGLIQQSTNQVINGLPGLINLPVLGALFRSRDYQRKETELMIMVTPFIAQPMNPGQVARPDDGFVEVPRRTGTSAWSIEPPLWGRAGEGARQGWLRLHHGLRDKHR